MCSRPASPKGFRWSILQNISRYYQCLSKQKETCYLDSQIPTGLRCTLNFQHRVSLPIFGGCRGQPYGEPALMLTRLNVSKVIWGLLSQAGAPPSAIPEPPASPLSSLSIPLNRTKRLGGRALEEGCSLENPPILQSRSTPGGCPLPDFIPHPGQM